MKKLQLIQACKELVQKIGVLYVDAYYAHYYGGSIKDSTMMKLNKSDLERHFNDLMQTYEDTLVAQWKEEEQLTLALYTVEFTDNTEVSVMAYDREEALEQAEILMGKTGFYVYFVRSIEVENMEEAEHMKELHAKKTLCEKKGNYMGITQVWLMHDVIYNDIREALRHRDGKDCPKVVYIIDGDKDIFYRKFEHALQEVEYVQLEKLA